MTEYRGVKVRMARRFERGRSQSSDKAVLEPKIAQNWRELFPRASALEDEAVKCFPGHLEIGLRAQKIFDELGMETQALGKAVASLNTVRRKGKTNVNIIYIEEDEEMGE
ncbi:hypothetical protein B0H13DRAFT_1864521 [Mycena leptocephala]|nr:hypothetical protein B0H13DRAFT_1864521 [Mycena leptocephala]